VDGNSDRPVARSEAQKLVRMEERLRQRVIGQDDALGRVSNAYGAARSLSDVKRPIGSSFPVDLRRGQNGAGAALAEFSLDDEKLMIRIDMSEYMEKHSVSRLIGAPPGYVATRKAAAHGAGAPPSVFGCAV